jgi:hypothetical protein
MIGLQNRKGLLEYKDGMSGPIPSSEKEESSFPTLLAKQKYIFTPPLTPKKYPGELNPIGERRSPTSEIR